MARSTEELQRQIRDLQTEIDKLHQERMRLATVNAELNNELSRRSAEVVSQPPQTLVRLDSLATSGVCQRGWYEANTPAVTDAVFAAVRRFLSYPTAIVPTVAGGIQLEWHSADVDVELEFNADGRPMALYGTRCSDGFNLTGDDAPASAEGSIPSPSDRGK